jgi:hypothetical protein
MFAFVTGADIWAKTNFGLTGHSHPQTRPFCVCAPSPGSFFHFLLLPSLISITGGAVSMAVLLV